MRYYLDWNACEKGKNDVFPASVPGNVQSDYAKSHNYGDLQYNDNFKEYTWMEDVFWIYKTTFSIVPQTDEQVYFVSYGIDYEYKIYINGNMVHHNVGMYSKIDINITPYLNSDNNELCVEIFPVPKSEFSEFADRDQANQAVKPPVSYGWDWHPRLVPSGMWQEAFVETRKSDFINDFEVFYVLSDDLKSADISFYADCSERVEISLYSPSGKLLYKGFEESMHLDDVELWWCNGQGEQSLYRWTAKTESDFKEGNVGFKKVELVMNEGAWDEPDGFPKSRSTPPITIKLNNRRIFCKGSNWVNPEIFYGETDYSTYETQIRYAKEANMNMFRCWGGAGCHKDSFYELCDKYGIMVWQEFPLACNNYLPTNEYMGILEHEATSIVKKLRRYACHVMWCGGNELFNNWSKMTDQSPALRLLNKICFECDREKPYIMTSPVMGMAHGHYLFYDFESKKDVFEIINGAHNTAYTEFAVPSIAPIETIKHIIPENEIDSFAPGGAWETHCAFNAWGARTWICDDIIEFYFGKQKTVEDYIKYSNILECEGYKAIFGEARRQWPRCSMALNWVYNEPWMNAAGNNLIAYPSVRKPAYYAVKEVLSPITFTIRAKCFSYKAGDEFSMLIYYHNDTIQNVNDTVDVHIKIDDTETFLLSWNAEADALSNKKGPMCHFTLPETEKITIFDVFLKSKNGIEAKYHFLLRPEETSVETRLLNQ